MKSIIITHSLLGNAAETKVGILVEVKDKATATLGNIQSKLNSFGSSFEKVAKISAVAIAATATAVVAFGVSAVKAFAGAEVQMARFNTMVKNVPGNTKAMTDQLLKAADAAVKLGFDDEDAANSLANLYQRTHDVSKAMELNNFAMDLARAKNISLEEASRAVSMVLSGNAKALKEYGIELDETKTPMQGLAEAQKVLTGQAAAYADTIQGKLEIMGIQWTNLKENIGGVFAPVVTSALGMVMGWVEKLQGIDFQGMFNNWKDGAVSFFNTFNENFGIIEHFKEVWAVVVEFFNTYLKPSWDGLLTTIKENKDVLLLLMSYFTKFLGVIAGAAFIGAMSVIVTLFEGLGIAINGVKSFVNDLADAFISLSKFVQKAFDTLSTFANKFGLSSLSKSLSNIGSSVSGFFGGAKAEGGSVNSSSQYLVGERGPEMFTPSSSGTIIPNNRMGGSSAITININGGNYLSKDAAIMFGDVLIEQLKLNMKI